MSRSKLPRPWAQARSLVPALAAAAAAVAAAWPAVAQEAGATRFVLEPSFTLQQTFTDNVDLDATPRADAVTTLSPGLRISGNSGGTRLALDYTLNALVHARASEKNELQNALSALASTELLDDRLSLEGRASISRRAVSAFGLQPGAPGLANDNTTEVATLALSPVLRGRLAGAVDVVARATWAVTEASDTGSRGPVQGGDGTAGSVGLSLGAREGRLGWGVDLTHEVDDTDTTDKLTQTRAIASLSYAPDVDWRFTLRGGREASEFGNAGATWAGNWGYGIEWFPTPRTSASFQSDRRFFGRSHSFAFSHRMARSVWSYTDSRGLSGGDISTLGVDRLFQQLDALTESFRKAGLDETRARQLARAVLGLDPLGNTGFLNSLLSVQRSQALSVVLNAIRTSVSITATRGQTRRIQGLTYENTDLATVERVQQYGWTLGLSHRLTPELSLAASASRQRTQDAGVLAGNDTLTATFGLSATLGPRTTGAISLRHTASDSRSTPYDESAVTGSISMRF